MESKPMMQRRIAGLLLMAGLAAGALPAGGESTSTTRRATIQREADSLTALLLPKIAEMNGFRESHAVVNEAATKPELRETLVPTAREYYGPDGFEKAGRVGSALGLLPPDYDLEAGTLGLLIELMGGGYDPLHKRIYVLADLPSSIAGNPSLKRMIAAHEITHALQDQNRDMAAEIRHGILYWDHGFLYNCVIEGIAYVTMMAILNDTSLAQAPDPTEMLQSTRRQMASSPEFKEYARSPRYVRESIFGAGFKGIAFCRALLREHPETKLATLLDSLPASSEQVLHFEKYKENDRPTPIDLSSLSDHLSADWEAYFANSLGEFHVQLLCESHEATEKTGEQIAAGWDGCQFQAFTDDEDRLVILGLSAWDTQPDAREFTEGFAQVLADIHDPETYAVEQDGRFVRFVIGPSEGEARRLSLEALASAQAASPREE